MREIEQEQLVRVRAGTASLEGNLVIPVGALGIIVFAHGSGSSRHSPRNRYVAEQLQRRQLGTLLMDLLTAAEERVDERTRALRFDIGLLAGRLGDAAQWLTSNAETRTLPIGYFGASTGAAAALVAAAGEPGRIGAVVSRGGRPDLAGPALTHVKAPTLLIVGGDDIPVIELNHEAYAELQCEKRLEIVPGASHLFEEPGTLGAAARLAGDWFVRWLGDPTGREEKTDDSSRRV